ncbi:DUF1254 domain-containing protein [Pelomonas sp. KK5]|uniref:DUF1254 domain-containing protein n=1 Tax=Pelomonas sp. KK5 TaxID=1855730 RepID=UPI0009F88619|nr:DUF1254 domain-containing protein [Pelomonas sp. KK5]
MHRILLASALAALALLPAAGFAAARDWPPAGEPPSPETTVHQAFDYAYPLVAMGRLRAGMLAGRSQLNVWLHQRKLSGPEDRWVTTPNNDTAYSTLWLDLRQGPVTLTLPDMDGRYHSLAFMDMATNNFEVLGRRATGTRGASYVLVGPDSTQPLPPDARVIRAPGNDVLVLARILVNDAADLPAVIALQDRFKVEAAGQATAPWQGPAPQVAEMTPAAFLAMANLMLERNPPPRYEEALMKRLAGVGLCGAACGWEALTPDMRALWTREMPAMLASLKGGLAGSGGRVEGWSYSKPDLGNFGTDYFYRAQVALGGLLALPPVEAMYPTAFTDRQQQRLDGAHRYRLHLAAGALPVNGFWSLSMYQVETDGKLFFTANPVQRYAIGDRTPGPSPNPDGSIDILMQREAPADPAQRANWLPTPPGEFALVLRAYEPKAALRDGRVHVPGVERLD